MSEVSPVIGLEVHAQLLTRSKMFCGCAAKYFDAPPNSHVCAICAGMPGSLPVINRTAVHYTVSTALALNCTVETESKFDRKNYSYPDIPKGYQISQYDMPIGRNGWLDYRLDGQTLRCGITRVHLEEDTGKSLHTTVDGREVSLVDYNRSGVPLMEIVTEPQLSSPGAARQFFEALRQLLVYLGVSDGKLQEGSMRADVNVSLAPANGAPGTKVEIKNLNSFRSVERALAFELERQRESLANGKPIVQETRGWSEERGITISQRTKEYAHDYRYFPEPDLPPLIMTRALVDELEASLPELPAQRLDRLQNEYALSTYTARVLTGEKELSEFFEEVLRTAPELQPVTVANWVTGDLVRLSKDSARPVSESRISPASFGRLLLLVQSNAISGTAAKQVLEAMFETGEDPHVIVNRQDLGQIVEPTALKALVERVLDENPEMVADYRRGKINVDKALMGKIIASSKGKASPQLVTEILQRKLASDI